VRGARVVIPNLDTGLAPKLGAEEDSARRKQGFSHLALIFELST
jgi:hypothetical protein